MHASIHKCKYEDIEKKGEITRAKMKGREWVMKRGETKEEVDRVGHLSGIEAGREVEEVAHRAHQSRQEGQTCLVHQNQAEEEGGIQVEVHLQEEGASYPCPCLEEVEGEDHPYQVGVEEEAFQVGRPYLEEAVVGHRQSPEVVEEACPFQEEGEAEVLLHQVEEEHQES